MQNDQSDRPHDTKSFAEQAGLEPIVIEHSSLRGWEFPKVSVEIFRRFSEANAEQLRQALRKTHPHLPLDENSMDRNHVQVVAMSLA